MTTKRPAINPNILSFDVPAVLPSLSPKDGASSTSTSAAASHRLTDDNNNIPLISARNNTSTLTSQATNTINTAATTTSSTTHGKSGKHVSALTDDDAFHIILDCNGYTMSEYRNKEKSSSGGITYLEIFQIARYRRMQGLHYFKHVKHLEIMHQNIQRMENLDQLHNLEILYLLGNSIKHIEGLDNCQKLQSVPIAMTNMWGGVGSH